MIFEINEVEVTAGEAEAFECAFARAAELLLQVSGCRSASLLRCVEQPNAYHVQVQWERIEDHLETYPATAQASQIRDLLRPFIARAKPAHFAEIHSLDHYRRIEAT